MKSLVWMSIFITLIMGHISWAQESDVSDIENELSKSKVRVQVDENVKFDQRASGSIGVTNLTNLQSFSEVTVLQKKFLPKTKRFQFNSAVIMGTNDPFFSSVGPAFRMGYYFNESLGMEANAFFFSSNPRDSVKDLAKNNGVLTSSLVSAKSYMGIDAQWIPIYGKIALYNKKIVPFDLYLATGYGLTGTTNGQSAGTLHLGTGQIFAISKGMAWRWDFSWNFYSAKGIDGKIQSFNDLFLSVGVSLFFPEAKYR